MKQKIKILIIGLILISIAFHAVAGGQKEKKAGAKPEYVVYAVVHGGIGEPYWKKIEQGIKDAAALVPDLQVVYVGPDVFNFEQFMSMLESALTSKPDGLIATMTNPPAMETSLRNAIKNGLPVMAIDSADSRPLLERIPYISYIGEISYEGGVLVAKEILSRYRPKRVLYAIEQIGALNLVERGRGIVDVMKKAGVPTEILETTEDPAQGAELVLSYLKAHPETDTFNASILLCEALVTRLEEEGIKPGKDIRISTFGLSEGIMAMMEQGKIDFSIDEQPYMQGFLGVTFMYLHLKYGFTPPSEIPTLGLFPKDISKLKDAVKKRIR
ncbi:MAG: substrate-binding domain-containing protein [Spirochaetota bacterium]